MPDLTIENHWLCQTARDWIATVEGHSVSWGTMPPRAGYGYGFRCDCKGFRFRGTCRHVKAAEPLRCGWEAFTHGGQPIGGKCPRCGGPVTAEAYAV
jgi:hypothetical protein